ncbi:galactose mutarotase [Fulvimarina endophytica]|uniref:Aldose 1-epimerase n=1 Tax=Fulvimarina endophytica TaxID=2293836 RepID=A0A371X0Q7_9HYPH|nr:aldose epimerase family protein [Fulvimarina endophytica]RFC62807.1 galactose mutarotase [Fulvimarina endophytica]
MAKVTERRFGTLSTGEDALAFDLETEGLSVTVVGFGAMLQAVRVLDRTGRIGDVVLGYDELRPYETHPQHFGVSVGRFANRIARGRFTLDGRDYRLETNDGPNHLHGGSAGFGVMNWRVEAVEAESANPSVTFALSSPDGDGGYPGTLHATARYELTGPGELTLTYEAVSEAPTLCNLTNHAYFNLGGVPTTESVENHHLTLAADRYLPVDDTFIPTGEVRSVKGSVFDFRNGKRVAEGLRDGSEAQMALARGFDHCMVLADDSAPSPRFAARLADERSGRVLEFLTTAPGLQFYSGNSLFGGIPGKGGRLTRMGDGLCLEPQLFPDAPNQPHFPSARLDTGETFRQVSIYRFTTA